MAVSRIANNSRYAGTRATRRRATRRRATRRRWRNRKARARTRRRTGGAYHAAQGSANEWAQNEPGQYARRYAGHLAAALAPGQHAETLRAALATGKHPALPGSRAAEAKRYLSNQIGKHPTAPGLQAAAGAYALGRVQHHLGNQTAIQNLNTILAAPAVQEALEGVASSAGTILTAAAAKADPKVAKAVNQLLGALIKTAGGDVQIIATAIPPFDELAALVEAFKLANDDVVRAETIAGTSAAAVGDAEKAVIPRAVAFRQRLAALQRAVALASAK